MPEVAKIIMILKKDHYLWKSAKFYPITLHRVRSMDKFLKNGLRNDCINLDD